MHWQVYQRHKIKCLRCNETRAWIWVKLIYDPKFPGPKRSAKDLSKFKPGTVMVQSSNLMQQLCFYYSTLLPQNQAGLVLHNHNLGSWNQYWANQRLSDSAAARRPVVSYELSTNLERNFLCTEDLIWQQQVWIWPKLHCAQSKGRLPRLSLCRIVWMPENIKCCSHRATSTWLTGLSESGLLFRPLATGVADKAAQPCWRVLQRGHSGWPLLSLKASLASLCSTVTSTLV